MEKHREYTGIDLLKLIFSFFVVFIHCHPREDPFSFTLANGVGRLAVPFFFCAAGFFLAKKTLYAPAELCRKNRNAFLWRILKMYLIWTAVYLPFKLVALRVGGGYDLFSCVIEYLRGLFFTGSYYHLWYLPALAFGALLVSVLSRRMKVETVFVLFLGVYLVGIFNEAYTGLCPPGLSDFYERIYNPIFERTRNGFFFAPIFVAMGYLFARFDAEKRSAFKGTPRRDLLLAVFFTVLTCIEALLLEYNGITNDRYGMYIFVVPATFFCFAAAKELELGWSEKKAYAIRKLSTAIYLVHHFVYSALVVTLTDTLLGLEEISRFWKFLVVMALTLLWAWGMVAAGRKKTKLGRFFRSLC
jgi:serine/alanine racemase